MSDPTTDPVEAAARALRAVNEGGDPCETCDQDALTIMEALHAAGWRIVRLGPTSAFDPPDDWEPSLDDPPGWDRSGVFYDDDDRPDGCVPLYRITDEWQAIDGAPT